MTNKKIIFQSNAYLKDSSSLIELIIIFYIEFWIEIMFIKKCTKYLGTNAYNMSQFMCVCVCL